ncbi:MAG: tyrosine-protein phosphatase [Miltoncostaeaceae bacterium]
MASQDRLPSHLRARLRPVHHPGSVIVAKREKRPAKGTAIVDIHTHLLHNVDDGPTTVTEALDLARAFTIQGCSTVVSTPHLNESYPTSAEVVEERAKELNEAIERAGLDLELLTGAEIGLVEAQRRAPDELRAFALGSSRWLLIEMPHVEYPFGIEELIGRLRADGYEVMLAHPERNPHCQEDLRVLERALDAGAVSQVTGASLRGALGGRVRETAWEMVRCGLVHSIASDAHDTLRRPPDLGEVRLLLHDHFGADVAATLTRGTAEAVLSDARLGEVRSLPVPVRRRRRNLRARLRRASLFPSSPRAHRPDR